MLQGGHAELFLEAIRKILTGVEADTKSDFGDGARGCGSQQLAGMKETDQVQLIRWRGVEQLAAGCRQEALSHPAGMGHRADRPRLRGFLDTGFQALEELADGPFETLWVLASFFDPCRQSLRDREKQVIDRVGEMRGCQRPVVGHPLESLLHDPPELVVLVHQMAALILAEDPQQVAA